MDNKKKDAGLALNIINRRDILILIAFIFMFLALMTWIIFGYVKDTVEVEGFYSVEGDLVVINEPYNGIITEMDVNVGDYVKKGDILARIYRQKKDENPDYEKMAEESQIMESPESGYIVDVGPVEWSEVLFSNELVTMIVCEKAEDEDISKPIDSIYAFVDRDTMDKIMINYDQTGRNPIKCYIEPHGFNTEAYGYTFGTVSGFDDTKTGYDETLIRLKAAALSNTENETYLPIMIKTDNLSNKGREYKPELNSECNVEIIISNKHPYELIFNR